MAVVLLGHVKVSCDHHVTMQSRRQRAHWRGRRSWTRQRRATRSSGPAALLSSPQASPEPRHPRLMSIILQTDECVFAVFLFYWSSNLDLVV